MRGEIAQTPPRYSAVKIDGRRSYALARAGKDVEPPARTVRIDELALLSYEPPRARFRVKGSKGLYVRSIARDARDVGQGEGRLSLRRPCGASARLAANTRTPQPADPTAAFRFLRGAEERALDNME